LGRNRLTVVQGALSPTFLFLNPDRTTFSPRWALLRRDGLADALLVDEIDESGEISIFLHPFFLPGASKGRLVPALIGKRG
jgi:hypothetical protein